MAVAADALLPDTTESSSDAHRESLEFAIAVWRERSKTTNYTVHAVTDTVTAPPDWTGLAADAYTGWLHTHRDQWQELHEDATRIRDALAAHDTPNTTTTRLAAVPAGLSPAGLSPADVVHSVVRRIPLPDDTTPHAAAPDDAPHGDSHPHGWTRPAAAPVASLLTSGKVTPPRALTSAPAEPDPMPAASVAAASIDDTDTDTDTDEGPQRNPAAATDAAAEPKSPQPGRSTDHPAPATSASTLTDTADINPTRSDHGRSDDGRDDLSAPPTNTFMTNAELAAALLGGGIAGGAATMAVIGTARPARALQVVPQIAHPLPDGQHPDGPDAVALAPTQRPGVPVVNHPGGADAPAVSWTASPTAPPPTAPPPTATPSVPPPLASGGNVASASASAGAGVAGGRIGLDPDTVAAALDALTTFPGRDKVPNAAATTADHRDNEAHTGPDEPPRVRWRLVG